MKGSGVGGSQSYFTWKTTAWLHECIAWSNVYSSNNQNVWRLCITRSDVGIEFFWEKFRIHSVSERHPHSSWIKEGKITMHCHDMKCLEKLGENNDTKGKYYGRRSHLQRWDDQRRLKSGESRVPFNLMERSVCGSVGFLGNENYGPPEATCNPNERRWAPFHIESKILTNEDVPPYLVSNINAWDFADIFSGYYANPSGSF